MTISPSRNQNWDPFSFLLGEISVLIWPVEFEILLNFDLYPDIHIYIDHCWSNWLIKVLTVLLSTLCHKCQTLWWCLLIFSCLHMILTLFQGHSSSSGTYFKGDILSEQVQNLCLLHCLHYTTHTYIYIYVSRFSTVIITPLSNLWQEGVLVPPNTHRITFKASKSDL